MTSLTSVGLVAAAAVLVASAALVPLVARRRQLAGWLNAASALAAALAFGASGAGALAGGATTFHLPLGFTEIHLLVDGFSALFLVLTAGMAAVVAVYAVTYMDRRPQQGLAAFYCNYPLFVLGMAAILLVDDLSWGFTAAWQLMTVSSFFLIRLDRSDPRVARAAVRYLVFMEAAWLLVAGGALALTGSFAGEPLGELARATAAAPRGIQVAGVALAIVGFALKAGVFPLGQLWVPDAYAAAPTPVSALLSGVLSKTGFYGIVRTLFWVVPAASADPGWRYLGLIVAATGAASLFIGTVQALKQHDAKRLHAYHSIGQMGYMLLGVGAAQFLWAASNPMLQALAVLALVGGVYHALNHAIFKGLLFLVTGSVEYATGTRELDKLGGLVRSMPVTAAVAAVAAAAIAGVPTLSGFASKWAIVASNLLAGRDGPPLVFFGIIALMTSAITLASYVKFFGMTFTSAGSEWHAPREVREVGMGMLAPKVVLAGLAILQGLFPWVSAAVILRAFAETEGSAVAALVSDPALSSRLAASGAGLTLTFAGAGAATLMPVVLLVALAVAVAFAAWLRRAGGAEARAAEPWMCGYQRLNDGNRYPSRNLYAAFKKATRWTGAE